MIFVVDQKLDCVHNAYKNLLLARSCSEDPRVLFHMVLKHAYLKRGGDNT